MRYGFICGLCFCANSLGVRLGLVRRLIDLLANFRDVLVFIGWLYIDDKTFPIGRADNPPTRLSRIGKEQTMMAAVMPTMLLLEGLAQTAGALCMHYLEVKEPPLTYFMSIDKARLRRAVRPGDVVFIAWRKFAVAGAYGDTGAGLSLKELLLLRPNLARQ